MEIGETLYVTTPAEFRKWLLKNHRNLIDAEFALNEGGWGEEAGASASATTCR